MRQNEKYFKFNAVYPIAFIFLVISIQGIKANSIVGSLPNLLLHVNEFNAVEKQTSNQRTPIDKIHSIKNTKFNIVLYINESLRAKNMSLYGYERDTDILTNNFFKVDLNLIIILQMRHQLVQVLKLY